MSDVRYLVPRGAQWCLWEDVNGCLTFWTDAAVVRLARENERELGADFVGTTLPADPTAEEAWEYIHALWSDEPGGRGWEERIPSGATWVELQSDDGDSNRGGPEPVFGFGEPPTGDGTWRDPGY